jgi:hypothetical protein
MPEAVAVAAIPRQVLLERVVVELVEQMRLVQTVRQIRVVVLAAGQKTQR